MLAVSAGDVVSVVSLPSYSLVHSWKLPSCIMVICFTPGGDLVVAYGIGRLHAGQRSGTIHDGSDRKAEECLLLSQLAMDCCRFRGWSYFPLTIRR